MAIFLLAMPRVWLMKAVSEIQRSRIRRIYADAFFWLSQFFALMTWQAKSSRHTSGIYKAEVAADGVMSDDRECIMEGKRFCELITPRQQRDVCSDQRNSIFTHKEFAAVWAAHPPDGDENSWCANSAQFNN